MIFEQPGASPRLLTGSVEEKQPVHDRYQKKADQHRKTRASRNHKYQRLQYL